MTIKETLNTARKEIDELGLQKCQCEVDMCNDYGQTTDTSNCPIHSKSSEGRISIKGKVIPRDDWDSFGDGLVNPDKSSEERKDEGVNELLPVKHSGGSSETRKSSEGKDIWPDATRERRRGMAMLNKAYQELDELVEKSIAEEFSLCPACSARTNTIGMKPAPRFCGKCGGVKP